MKAVNFLLQLMSLCSYTGCFAEVVHEAEPELRTISTDFVHNLVSNLQTLGIENYIILTTKPLCRKLQQHSLACAWTSLWSEHPGLARWGLKPGNMFLMWQQQWHYISRALERGHSVLRADTDVYFAEDPFPILKGPLLAPFSMVVQQDFGGPLGNRPGCRQVARPHHAQDGTLGSCGAHRGTALLNVGLVFARAGAPGGGALAVINSTWARFHSKLGGPAAHVDTLIDQPLMRAAVDEMAVAEAGKARHQWTVVPGSAAPVYPGDRAEARYPHSSPLSHA